MKQNSLRTLVALLIYVLLFSGLVYAEEGVYLEEANQLKTLHVFTGSETGFELNREPTRLEGGIVFVKLLGEASTALEMNYSHPFTDVPDWGSPFVGYLYEKGYTQGTSSTTFGSEDKMQAKSYLTFILRALEYDDKIGDFTWNDAIRKAKEINLIDTHLEGTLNEAVFLRDHLAKVSLEALKTNLKNKPTSLAQKLIDKGAISGVDAAAVGLIETNTEGSMKTLDMGDVLLSIEGVDNFIDLNGLRYYRPLTEQELTQIAYDSLDTMDIYHNEYTISELKGVRSDIDWDRWMMLKWGKFDWNDQSHGSNLEYDAYWEDYDGNTPATAGRYASAFGLRLPTEEELKLLFSSLKTSPEADLGWPSGYFWTGDVSSEGPDYHRFVDSLTQMGQQYNDTRDYFVILVGEPVLSTSSAKKSPEKMVDQIQNIEDVKSTESIESTDNSEVAIATDNNTGIFASSAKLPGMTDIKGVANSISINGVLIYRPLTQEEAITLLGDDMYDFAVPGSYGYSDIKEDEYTITLAEEKEKMLAANPNIDWDAWFEMKWPIYDNSFDPHMYGPGDEYEGDAYVTDGDILSLYKNESVTTTPKYLLNELLAAYPDGQVTAVFGWPTNFSYLTSSSDEFGNVYTTNLLYESSSIHIGRYDPGYVSLIHYSDVIYEKLTESSLKRE